MKKKLPYGPTTIDNIRTGLGVAGVDTAGLELDKAELKAVMKVFKKITGSDEYLIKKNSPMNEGNHKLTLELQKERGSERWFFNVEGNPIGHFKGHNIRGNPNAALVIRLTYEKTLKWLEEKSGLTLPRSMWAKVEARQIFIHYLEFAAYTAVLKAPVTILLNAAQAMFRLSDWKDEKGMHINLDKLLGVNSRMHKEEYESSFAVFTVEKGGNPLVGICMYQKDVEMKGSGIRISDETMKNLQGRLRIDVHFSNRWLTNRKIKTVRDLEAYVKNRPHKSWEKFVHEELLKVVEKSCIQYMWRCPNIFDDRVREEIPKQWFAGVVDDEVREWASEVGVDTRVSYQAHAAMLWARGHHAVSGAEKLESLGSIEKRMRIAQKEARATNQVERQILKAFSSIALETSKNAI